MSARRFVAALLAIPALLAALVLIGVESWRWYRSQSPLFTGPVAASLAAAIEMDDLLQAYQFLRGGWDPGARIEVHHPVLTGGAPARVQPLSWAIALRNRDAVRMLVGAGAVIDRRAVCLAHALGDDDLAAQLRTDGALADEPCPSRDADTPPLLTVAANGD